jgi:uncharacterized membrane protein YcgQ (UPF0703/DUF1980 family)
MNNNLADYLSHHLTASSDPVLKAFVDDINAQLDDSVISIIFYGSCLRSQKYDDAMLDFYVIVDEYKNCYSSRLEAIVNSILPPNVYFLPTHVGEKKYISKYAVISYQQLVSNVSEKSFHPYFWARFCQPISTLYLKNDQARKDIVNIQVLAVETFLLATRDNSYQSASYDNQSIWVRGFELTYAAELRAESKGRAKQIFENNKEFYSGITQTLQSDSSKSLFIESSKSHRLFLLSWRMRNILGRCLSIMRLFKASFTFKNGVDYIAWKIERHTGEKINVSPRLRKFPWIFAWPILFKLLSKRTIK